MYYFLPSLTFGLYIYVGVSDCLVLACAKVLGTLQPCQLLWPPKAFLLTKEASNLTLTSHWTRFPSMLLLSVRYSWRGAIGHTINFKYS